MSVINTGASGGGGGGGGAVTVANGADVAEGATTDAAVITDTTGTLSGKLRGLVKWAYERMPASLGAKTSAASFPVVLASDQAALAITAAALPLPAGAATAAKQPAFGTAGTASADVLSVQGIVGMTAVKVDGSGVTQPVSGTFWQATQPVSHAATKARTSIWSAQSLTAAAADTTSSAVDLTAALGATLNLKLTNGATGPTVAAQIQVQCSADNSNWYSYGGPLVGLTTNNGVQSWVVDLPVPVMYVRLVAGSNTGQAVTVDADIARVTG